MERALAELRARLDGMLIRSVTPRDPVPDRRTHEAPVIADPEATD
jgi:hypothetical protein